MNQTRIQLAPARRLRRGAKSFGFTLIELMVSMAVFLVIGGTAMSLFSQHAKLFNDQQGTVGLNISLRNALSQIENDTVQAGNGFYGSLSTANTPVGITITNNAGAFDSFYIIQAGTPTGVPLDPAIACPPGVNTTLGNATLVPPPGITTGNFPAGTVVLFMNGAGNQMTVATIKTATAAGTKINITYNGTNGDGTNGSGNDPFGLTAVPTALTDPDQFTSSFCPSNGDYVVPLTWVQYSVDAQNRLLRTNSGQPLNPDFIADQIIGFKVGAATFQSTGGTTSSPAYSFSAPSAPPVGYSSKFSLIRSVRVSIIGRTPPNKYTGTNFRNSFDGQNYKIESLSLVINPRNLSMND
jgi:prepilin-type N-terminal cleavage/methylation domain-containing protein